LRGDGAASGPEALQKLRTAVLEGHPYSLAFLDVQMPGMDGLTLAREIEADSHIAGTRLVALTSLGQTCSTEELKRAGIDTHLVKPVKESRLFDCILDLKTPDQSLVRETVILKSDLAVTQAGPQFGKARILLAEDNHINQIIAAGLLRKLGYLPDIVTNGLAALEALKNIPYDIIFMDCQMPEMDGYDAARRIRAQERRQNHGPSWKSSIHIIAITANAMEGDREKCIAAGMDEYLSKPIRLQELRLVLERWRAKNQSRSDLNSDALTPAGASLHTL
jgi:two-component system, sensor histidine kinase and response regulator